MHGWARLSLLMLAAGDPALNPVGCAVKVLTFTADLDRQTFES